jgi:tetratricopeptide (TPR) repeat protein
MLPMNNFRFSKLSLVLLVLLLSSCAEKSSAPQFEKLLTRSDAYRSQGQYKAATIEARNAIQANNKAIEGYLALARVYNDLNQAFATIQLLESRDLNNNPEAILLLSEAYIAKGKNRSARDLINSLPEQAGAKHKITIHLQLAEIALATGDFKAAEKEIKQAEEIKPNNVKSKILSARLAIAQQDLDKAKTILETIAETDQNAEALQIKAFIAYHRKQLDQAEEMLTEALIMLPQTDTLTPRRASILRQLTHVLTLQGRSAEALVYTKLLSEAAPIQKDNEEKLNQALSQYQQGNLDESKKALKEIHERVSNKEMTGQLLGLINFRQGNFEKAEQLLSAYVDTETASEQTLHALAASQIKLNKPKQLVELMDNEQEDFKKDPQLLTLYGIALLQEDRQQAGIKALQESISLDPEQEMAPLALAKFHMVQNQPEKALSVLNTAYRQPSLAGSEKLLSMIIGIYLDAGQTTKAEALINEKLAKHPNDSLINQMAGLIKLSNNQLDAGTAYLQKAVSLDSNNIKARIALGRTALERENWQEAEKIFSDLAKTNPNNPYGYQGILVANQLSKTDSKGIASLEAFIKNGENPAVPTAVLAQHAISNGDFEAAENYINSPAIQSSNDPYVISTIIKTRALLAQQSLAKQQFDDAKIHTIKGIELAPENLQLLSLLASIEVESGQTDEALKIAQRLKTIDPNSNLSYLLEGDIAYQQSNLKKAVNAYRKAWDLESSDTAGSRLYSALKASSNNDGAESFIQLWLQTHPDSEQALTFTALQKQSQQDYPAAIHYYEKLVKLNKASAVALNNLAWLYFEASDKRAADTAMHAYQLDQNNPAIIDTYGWILVQNGQVPAGIELLEDAAKRAPENTEINQHLEQARRMK